jgi:EAL domain-containing protein (putative c-di-GMP-specific phosphodiesterase class I)
VTGELDVQAAFQPIFDLRDGAVIGYEALARPRDGTSPEQLFAAARAAGRLAEVDRACRQAALREAAAAGLGAPFALFINADAGALEREVPELPPNHATLVMEITESALTERPDAVLRSLTALRTHGWGVSLDDIGADSRSLALMPLLYPDVIKLDLRLLDARDTVDVARVVTAVGAEAELRRASVLAEGIDSQAQLEIARAMGATLGQGYMLGEPGPLPAELPKPGRPLRLGGAGGDPYGPLPYQRVTNWKRPRRGRSPSAPRRCSPGRRRRSDRPGCCSRRPTTCSRRRAMRRCATRWASSACSSRARSRTRGPRSRSGRGSAPASSRGARRAKR